MDERTFYRLIGGILGAVDECADGLEKTVNLIKEINKSQNRINAINAIVTGGIAGYIFTQKKKIDKLSKDVKTLKTKGV